MNAIRRINPRRPYTHTAEGLKRIVLGQSASVGEDASTPAQAGAASAAALRSQAPAVRRMLAVAHSERGALSAGARQAVAAAALLAQADTAVHLLVFGDCRDDPAALGADMLIQAQAPAAHAPDLPWPPCWRKSPAIRRCTSSCPTRIPTTPTWAGVWARTPATRRRRAWSR